MKLLKILGLCVLTLCVLLLLGYFILTRPSVQLSLLKGKLPAGSSIDFIQITPSSVRVENASFSSADSGSVKFAKLSASYSLSDLLFRQQLSLGMVELKDLDLQVVRTETEASEVESTQRGHSARDEIQQYYNAGEITWPIFVEGIAVNGVVSTSDGYQVEFAGNSGKIAPDITTSMEFQGVVKLPKNLSHQVAQMDAQIKLDFAQRAKGGFDQVVIHLESSALDKNAAIVFDFSQDIRVQVDSANQSSSLQSIFSLNVGAPLIEQTDFASLGSVEARGELSLNSRGELLTAEKLDFVLSTDNELSLAVHLSQAVQIGAAQQFAGELLTIDFSKVALELANPMLPEGSRLSGELRAGSLVVTGLPDGALQLAAKQPLGVDALNYFADKGLILESLSIEFNPEVTVLADQSVKLDIPKFTVDGRSGNVATVRLSSHFKENAELVGLFPAGLAANGNLRLNLARLCEQPLIANQGYVRSGLVDTDFTLEGADDWPINLQTVISGLSEADSNAKLPQYFVDTQFRFPSDGVFELKSNLAVGKRIEPSSDMEILATVYPEKSPLEFDFSVNSASLHQADFMALSEVWLPIKQIESEAAEVGTTTAVITPPWSGYKGKGSLELSNLLLESGLLIADIKAQLSVDEPFLTISELSAALGGGNLIGRAKVGYDTSRELDYEASVDLKIDQIELNRLWSDPASAPPVSGIFSGSVDGIGRGETLESALNDLEGYVNFTGQNGILTAFKLDEQTQTSIGMIGNLLGQQLNQPGISAVANAIPYFREIKFDTLKLAVSRRDDKKLQIESLNLLSENLYLEGSGFIVATNLRELLNEPMNLALKLGAKGPLVKSLESLDLLSDATNTAGYREWNQSLKIDGTLADPNTDSLMDLLNKAAVSMLTKKKPTSTQPSNSSEPEKTEAPKTKSQKKMDDIEKGMTIINSIFGN